MMTSQDIPIRAKAEIAEALSHYLTELQADYGFSFSEAVGAIRAGLDNAYSDDDMPGGGYIVIT